MDTGKYKGRMFTNLPDCDLITQLLNLLTGKIATAKDAMEKGNYEVSNSALIDAQEIILDFCGTLTGGDAGSRKALAVMKHLAEALFAANLRKEPAMLDDIRIFVQHLSSQYAIQIRGGPKTWAGPP